MENQNQQIGATAKQIAFLQTLTGKGAEDFASLSKREASIAIGKALKAKKAGKDNAEGKDTNRATRRAKAEKPRLSETSEGVKVGDVFSVSWGYDCTINNFFEVVEVVSAHTVKVRELATETTCAYGAYDGKERALKGVYLDRSFWAGKERPGADPNDANLLTKQIRKSPYHNGKRSLYIALGQRGEYRAYYDEEPETPRAFSER